MKIETAEQRTLTADEGMFLTHGETAGQTVILPDGADFSEWYEITEEEYNESFINQLLNITDDVAHLDAGEIV